MTDTYPAGNTIRNENYLSYKELAQRAVNVNRIVPDDYFRVKKAYDNVNSHPIYTSQDFYSNYKKPKKSVRSHSKPKKKAKAPIKNNEALKNKDLKAVNKLIISGDVAYFKEFVKKLDVKLPNNTLYTIDKVVRDRLREGRFGIDFSEYINLEKEEEHKYHYYHHDMLTTGKTSIQIPYVPHSVLLSEKLKKSPILPENRQNRNPSRFDTVRRPKTAKRAKTISKYGSCRKGLGTAKEEFSDWRMRKQAVDRLRNKLIDQAKAELRQEIYHDMINAYHVINQAVGIDQQSDQKSQAPVVDSNKKEELKPVENDVFDARNTNFKDFQDFCRKTNRYIYPNPVF